MCRHAVQHSHSCTYCQPVPTTPLQSSPFLANPLSLRSPVSASHSPSITRPSAAAPLPSHNEETEREREREREQVAADLQEDLPSKQAMAASLAPLLAVAFLAAAAQAADPFAFFDWDVSYITASPLGVPQQVRPSSSATTTSPQLCVSFLQSNPIQSGLRLFFFIPSLTWLGLDFASSYPRPLQHFVFSFSSSSLL